MSDYARALATYIAARTDQRSQRGATAVEYAILVSLIAAVLFVVITQLGKDVDHGIDSLESQLPNG